MLVVLRIVSVDVFKSYDVSFFQYVMGLITLSNFLDKFIDKFNNKGFDMEKVIAWWTGVNLRQVQGYNYLNRNILMRT